MQAINSLFSESLVIGGHYDGRMQNAQAALSQTKDAIDHYICEQMQLLLPTLIKEAGIPKNSFPPELWSILNATMMGGKRYRALAAVIGAAMAHDAEEPSTATKMALQTPFIWNLIFALELYQAAALVHDDIVDRAETRRGLPSTYVALRAHHRSEKWFGDPNHFGKAAGILVGDLLLATADSQAAKCDKKVTNRFLLMVQEVALGQYLDLSASQQGPGTNNNEVEDSLSVVRLKSARYSVTHPLTLGALAAGDSDEAVAAIEQAFEPVGVAFQLQDDHLGIWGAPDVTGKPSGSDIIEGKRTTLLALTAKHSDNDSKALLQKIYAKESRTAEDVAVVQRIMEQYGLAPHQKLIENATEESTKAIQRLAISPGAKALAKCHAANLTKRSF
jgi:Geranylgeranyl pyrophosphate synthase